MLSHLKKGFVWTDDEVKLLLNVTHNYEVRHLVEGTCWESVHLKYTDILELFRNELPETEEEVRQILRNNHTNGKRSSRK